MFEVRWQRSLHQAGAINGIALGGGALVAHERLTRLVRLDPADGSVLWDVAGGRWPRAIVLAGQRCLVLPQDTDRLLCLDLGTGEGLWRVDLPPWTGHVVVNGDVILIGGWRGYSPLRALDLTTGQLLWQTDHRVHTARPLAVPSPPAVSGSSADPSSLTTFPTTEVCPLGGGFLLGQPGDSRLRLIAACDGLELATWSLPDPLLEHDNRPAFAPLDHDRVLVRCGDRSVAEISLSDGATRHPFVAEIPLASSAPQYLGDLLGSRTPAPATPSSTRATAICAGGSMSASPLAIPSSLTAPASSSPLPRASSSVSTSTAGSSREPPWPTESADFVRSDRARHW